MKMKVVEILLSVLLCAQLVHAESWADDLFEKFQYRMTHNVRALKDTLDSIVQRQQKLDLKTFCDKLLNLSARASGEMSECSLRYARPMTTCVSCQIEYKLIKDTFDNMTRYIGPEFKDEFHELFGEDISKQNMTCESIYIMRDQIDVYSKIRDESFGPHSIWQKALCENCFENDNSTEGNIKPDIIDFISLIIRAKKCFETNYEKTRRSLKERFVKITEKEKCDICNLIFMDAFKFFKTNLQANSKNPTRKVCFPARDLMNHTSIIWNEELGCGWFYVTHLEQYTLTVITFCLTACLYVHRSLLSLFHYLTKKLPQRILLSFYTPVVQTRDDDLEPIYNRLEPRDSDVDPLPRIQRPSIFARFHPSQTEETSSRNNQSQNPAHPEDQPELRQRRN